MTWVWIKVLLLQKQTKHWIKFILKYCGIKYTILAIFPKTCLLSYTVSVYFSVHCLTLENIGTNPPDSVQRDYILERKKVIISCSSNTCPAKHPPVVYTPLLSVPREGWRGCCWVMSPNRDCFQHQLHKNQKYTFSETTKNY